MVFGKKTGLMDEIRCDEQSYLIWKWHPKGTELGDNKRENSIRWGSPLRVKDGEVAVFVYNQGNGIVQDYIEGPCDTILDTNNLPVLASIIGLAYNGGTPFQAEVYFINLARIIQVPFGIPYFDLFDPRFADFGVPTAVRGKLTFNINDYQEFIGLHRLVNFNLEDFQKQIKDSLSRYVKEVVLKTIAEKNIPVVQVESEIATINDAVQQKTKERLEKDFGVNVTALDINAIEIDKSSAGYQQLKSVTQDLTMATAQAQTQANIKNIEDMQRINAENMEENLRIQREEAQYAQRKQTQGANFAAYQLEQQAAVGIAGAEALGKMGANGATEVSGGGMNPAAMMAGMAMGGAIGQNMAGMMNGMMQGVNNPQQQSVTPPPIPNTAIHVVVNGQASGPFDMQTLSQMVTNGNLTKDSLVWKQGLADWVKAENLPELQNLFTNSVPPVPPVLDTDV